MAGPRRRLYEGRSKASSLTLGPNAGRLNENLREWKRLRWSTTGSMPWLVVADCSAPRPRSWISPRRYSQSHASTSGKTRDEWRVRTSVGAGGSQRGSPDGLRRMFGVVGIEGRKKGRGR